MWRPSVHTYCILMKTAITQIMQWWKYHPIFAKRGCACNLQHTQLFEYKRLLVICTATTEGGKLISTMKHLPLLDAPDYKVFTFLDKYKMSSLKEYKTKRVDLHAPYLM